MDCCYSQRFWRLHILSKWIWPFQQMGFLALWLFSPLALFSLPFFFFSFILMPLECMLVVKENSYHRKKTQKSTSTVFWKGGLYTGFTVAIKIDSWDSINDFILYGSKVNNVWMRVVRRSFILLYYSYRCQCYFKGSLKNLQRGED